MILTLGVGSLFGHNHGGAKAEKTVVDIAVGSADHTTLVAAVKAAGLVETLSGPGPFTIFAPTNAAFAKLPAGTVEDLLKPGAVKTVNGKEATIAISYGMPTINGAKIVATDLVGSNGVIHVIDTVILP